MTAITNSTSTPNPNSLLLRPLPVSLPRVEFWRVGTAPAPREVGERLLVEQFGYNGREAGAGGAADVDSEPANGEGAPSVPVVEGPYRRFIPPDAEQLHKHVEYDCDPADALWMDHFNDQRAKTKPPVAPVPYDYFEVVMDSIEKEWFALQAKIPRPDDWAPVEDSQCAVCGDGECENSNAIVFCDGCNLAVHQDCYGVPYIPEGQWLCRKCTVSPDRPVSCVLCPNEYGAFKQTTNGKWAHLLCAIWVNETGVNNTVYMEPVDGVEAIPKSRWKLQCYICRKPKSGACIQCSKSSCYTAYHVTCAKEAGCYMKIGTSSGATHTGDAVNVSFCMKHSPADHNAGNNGAEFEDEDAFDEFGTPAPDPPKKKKLQRYSDKHRNSLPPDSARMSLSGTPEAHLVQPPSANAVAANTSSKQSRAYNKSFRSGPPVIPQYVYDRVYERVKNLKCARLKYFVRQVCRYWSLKRETRRGAPLLKRLHLEPWTASSTSRAATDMEKEKKLQLILSLRADLEKVRTLTELIRKREREKLRRSQLFKSIVDSMVFPQTAVFKAALARIQSLDPKNLFLLPVSKADVPDYHEVVKHPMDWTTISEKLLRNDYLTAWDFQTDVKLVFSNALLYNKVDTNHGKAALRARELTAPLLKELVALDQPDSQLYRMFRSSTTFMNEDVVPNMFKLWYPRSDTAVVRDETANGNNKAQQTTSATVQLGKRKRMEGGSENSHASRMAEETPTPTEASFKTTTDYILEAIPSLRPPVIAHPPVSVASGHQKAQKKADRRARNKAYNDAATIKKRAVREAKRAGMPQHELAALEFMSVPAMVAAAQAAKAAAAALQMDQSALMMPAVTGAVPEPADHVYPVLVTNELGQTVISDALETKLENVTDAVATTAAIGTALAIEAEVLDSFIDMEEPFLAVDAVIEAEVEAQTTRDASPTRERRRTRTSSLDSRVAAEGAQSTEIPIITKTFISPDEQSAPSVEEVEQPGVESSMTVQVSEHGLPIERADVNPYDSFKMFETGWILPEGSKRARSVTSQSHNSAPRSRKGTASVSPMLPMIPLPDQDNDNVNTRQSKLGSMSPKQVFRRQLLEKEHARHTIIPEASMLSDSDLSDLDEDDGMQVDKEEQGSALKSTRADSVPAVEEDRLATAVVMPVTSEVEAVSDVTQAMHSVPGSSPPSPLSVPEGSVPQNTEGTAEVATRSQRAQEPKALARRDSITSVLSDLSALSDTGDADVEEAESKTDALSARAVTLNVSPVTDTSSAAKSKAGHRRRASSSTPRHTFAVPARTRHMRAAEAALLEQPQQTTSLPADPTVHTADPDNGRKHEMQPADASPIKEESVAQVVGGTSGSSRKTKRATIITPARTRQMLAAEAALLAPQPVAAAGEDAALTSIVPDNDIIEPEKAPVPLPSEQPPLSNSRAQRIPLATTARTRNMRAAEAALPSDNAEVEPATDTNAQAILPDKNERAGHSVVPTEPEVAVADNSEMLDNGEAGDESLSAPRPRSRRSASRVQALRESSSTATPRCRSSTSSKPETPIETPKQAKPQSSLKRTARKSETSGHHREISTPSSVPNIATSNEPVWGNPFYPRTAAGINLAALTRLNEQLATSASTLLVRQMSELEDGDTVWASVGNNPAYPAEICTDYDAHEVPDEVLAAQPKDEDAPVSLYAPLGLVNTPNRQQTNINGSTGVGTRKAKDKSKAKAETETEEEDEDVDNDNDRKWVLVQWYPHYKVASYSWVPLSKCVKCGDDLAFDAMMQSSSILPRQFKQKSHGIAKAYAAAKLVMQTVSEAEAEAAEEAAGVHDDDDDDM